jgi:hypothetical protein
LFLLLYSLYRFFHRSITFTHLIQNILHLFKSKIYKSAPLDIDRTGCSFRKFKLHFRSYNLKYSYNLRLEFRGGLFPNRNLLKKLFMCFWFPHVLLLSSNFLSLSSYPRSFVSHRSFPHFLSSTHKTSILMGRLQRPKKKISCRQKILLSSQLTDTRVM